MRVSSSAASACSAVLLLSALSHARQTLRRAEVAFDGDPDDDPNSVNWFLSSDLSCSSAESGTTMKCPMSADIHCQVNEDNVSVNMYCNESEKVSCADTLSAISADQPNGAGWMNPALMLGTSVMQAAASADGYSGTYAVVTIDALRCGQCVEVTPNDPDNIFPNAVPIIAQIFNSVAASIDVYMAGGGLGAYNGCAAVDGYEAPPRPFYQKYPNAANSDFVSYLESIGYTDTQYIDADLAEAGGIRGGATYADCVAAGGTMDSCAPEGNGCSVDGGMCLQDSDICSSLFEGHSDLTTNYAVESCKYAFEHDMHWNRNVTVELVACPASLTALTGLIPEAEDGNWEFVVGDTCTSPSCYQTTTMEDCSLPTCSRSSNTRGSATDANGVTYDNAYNTWKQGYNAVFGANLLGTPYTASVEPVDDPCPEVIYDPTVTAHPTPVPECAPAFSQCGGDGWEGYTNCCDGQVCVENSEYYSGCTDASDATRTSTESPKSADRRSTHGERRGDERRSERRGDKSADRRSPLGDKRRGGGRK